MVIKMPSTIIRPDGLVDNSPCIRIQSRYAGEHLTRPDADVHRCDSVSVCLESTVAPEVVVLCGFLPFSTSRTGLGSVFWIDWYCFNPFLHGFVCDGMSEQGIRYSVDFLSGCFGIFAFPCSHVFDVLENDVGIVFFGNSYDFTCYLEDSCFDIVPLFAREFSEFLSSFAVKEFVPVMLEFASPLFVSDLLEMYVLSEIDLFNPSFGSRIIHADCQPACVDVYSENIRHDFGFWKFLLDGSVEPEVFSHYDRCDFPSVLDMFKQPFVSTILSDWDGDSFVVESQGKDRVVSFGSLYGEESFIEPDCDLFGYSLFSDVPSIGFCLNNQLRSDVVFFSESLVNKVLYFSSRNVGVALFDFKDSHNHFKKSIVTFEKKGLLMSGWFKDIYFKAFTPQHNNITLINKFKSFASIPLCPEGQSLLEADMVNKIWDVSLVLVVVLVCTPSSFPEINNVDIFIK